MPGGPGEPPEARTPGRGPGDPRRPPDEDARFAAFERPASAGAPPGDVRTAAAVWTLPFAVALVVSLALPWASCPGCAGPVMFTAWSLPDSDAIGVSTGAEYGLCSIGGVLALVLTMAALITLRPALAALGGLVAAATTALGAYAIVTITRHGLDLEAGAPVAVGCAAVLTITLVRTRSRLASGT